MALSQAHRAVLFSSLAPVVGDDEAVHAMLGHFPAHDGEAPASKDFVGVSAAETRTEIAALRTEVHTEIADLRTEIAALRTEVHTEIGDLRTEMHTEFGKVRTEFGKVRTEIGDLRTEMHTEFGKVRAEMQTELGKARAESLGVKAAVYESANSQLRWFVTINFSVLAIAFTVMGYLR